MKDLDAALLAAHAAGDTSALIDLYVKASDAAETLDSEAFYLTHAYVFALEAGDARAQVLHAALVAKGREAPLPPAPAPKR